MPVFCALRRRLLTGLVVLGAVGLSGCGDDAGAPSEGDHSGAPDPEWSRPVAPEGRGSPDGPVDGVRGADDLLADLRTRIDEGRGHADASYQQSVELVAAVLWDAPGVGAPGDLEAVRTHLQTAAISGEVSHWLAASPSARAERSKTNPTDLAIHDAFLAASAKGADAYRAWCGAAGVKLLREHREATYRKLIPEHGSGIGGPGADGPDQGR